MMLWAIHMFFLAHLFGAGYVVWRGWKAARRSSLRHALIWSFLAWAAWLIASLLELATTDLRPARYLALSLSACAVVAVLGARQPGMVAWNFVVGGLLAVLLLPILHQPWNSPGWHLEQIWAGFLSILVLVGFVNYLPTRLWIAAVSTSLTFGFEIVFLAMPDTARELVPYLRFFFLMQLLLSLSLWSAAFAMKWPITGSPFDILWQKFRDCYGLVWGLRVQEQFNNAARNVGWKTRLAWRGLRTESNQQPTTEQSEEMLRTLRAILKRFGVESDERP